MKKEKFREKITVSGAHVIMGKDENSNDELMKEFEGKDVTILHTSAPGSPFGVIKSPLKPNEWDVYTSGAVVLGHSQDWRDNKKNVFSVEVFTGKDISKGKNMRPGTWKVKNSDKIKIKKEDVLKFESSLKKN